MILLGFFLLVSGWSLILAALILLGAGGPYIFFLSAGVAIQMFGFLLVLRAQLPRFRRSR